MSNNKKIQFFLIMTVVILVVCFMPHIGWSQPLPGDPPPPPCINPDDPACPIDGGLSLMIVAGVGYGMKKYKSMRNKVTV